MYELVEMTSGLLPWYWWLIVGLILLFFVVLEFAVRQNRRASRADAANAVRTGMATIPYNQWSRLAQIDLGTAAAIWSGTRDVNDVVRHLRFRELKQAVREGKLAAKSLPDGKVNRNTQVSPQELERFFRAFEPLAENNPSAGPPFPNMKLSELVQNYLGIEKFDSPDPEEKIGSFLHAVREAAVNGQIQIWGRKGCEKGMEDFDIYVREPIPNEYWKDCKINEYEFKINSWACTASAGTEYCEHYGDLQVFRQQVEKIWRKVNT